MLPVEAKRTDEQGGRGQVRFLATNFFPRAAACDSAAQQHSLRGGDEPYIDEGIAALARYSLIELSRDPRTGETLTLSVHRLVQEVTRLRLLDAGETDRWCGTAVRLLRHSVPAQPDERDAWDTAQVLEPHVISPHAMSRPPIAK